MIRVGLIGGRGYVGEELLKLFQQTGRHEVVFAGSRSQAGKPVRDEFPDLETELVFSPISPAAIAACHADAWIIAQDNGQAAEFASSLPADVPVIDISADFRFDNDWVYGLPAANSQRLHQAVRVANPGCYATAVQLALLPVADALDSTNPPVAFGISGYSGAGRTPGPRNDPQRLDRNVLPYSLCGHGHEREISHHLGTPVRFSPHVAPFFRGISVTVAVTLKNKIELEALRECYRDWCETRPLIRYSDEIPEIRDVRETNEAIVGGITVDTRDPHRAMVVCVIDNLRKGAASQAIENLNLMVDLPVETGLNP